MQKEFKGQLAELLLKRELARKNNDFQTADRIRAYLKAKGFDLVDTEEGPEVSLSLDREHQILDNTVTKVKL